jgi:hypothetical protein
MVPGTISGDREFLDEIEGRLTDPSISFERAVSERTVKCLIAIARRLLDEKLELAELLSRK